MKESTNPSAAMMKRRARIATMALVSGVGIGFVSIVGSPQAVASPGNPGLTDQQRQQIVSAFATAVVHDDHAGIAATAAPDIVWTIPGESVVSGQVSGVDAVAKLADVLAQYGLRIEVQGFAYGVDTVAVRLHDSGERNGKTLDQDVVNVLTIRNGKVANVAANLADVDQFDAYFS
ncbi:nuclear transport factor 2 family protein [Mycobacterium yunnanensis]|uniref:Nuclear transport factor 2 family protein n=1 Tax=Mycobacterium yunnanensis TaxID=368477 RepID=A0A9X2YQ88_9MYCO|nr:nuclear transport factor 2 family protein [Mycobacterium yunnanensis]MCV7423493.1 nuclear transport factor 2 family protein [Mycobacterium yunnanensis]